jgi:hypothetical protein
MACPLLMNSKKNIKKSIKRTPDDLGETNGLQ